MSEYTYKSLIIDPTSEEAKTCIGKRVYYSTNPTSCLQYANDHNMDCCRVLKGINPDDIYPFVLEDNTYLCSCIILCLEEPEPKYAPFKSKKEFLERYLEIKNDLESDSFEGGLLQCGMWLKIEGIGSDGYCMVTELWGDGVVLGYSKLCTMQNVSGGYTTVSETTSWEDLCEGFNFLDGSPCGRLMGNQ